MLAEGAQDLVDRAADLVVLVLGEAGAVERLCLLAEDLLEVQAEEGVECRELVPGVGGERVQIGRGQGRGMARGVDEARDVLEGPGGRQAGRVDRLARLELGGEGRHGEEEEGLGASCGRRVWVALRCPGARSEALWVHWLELRAESDLDGSASCCRLVAVELKLWSHPFPSACALPSTLWRLTSRLSRIALAAPCAPQERARRALVTRVRSRFAAETGKRRRRRCKAERRGETSAGRCRSLSLSSHTAPAHPP